MIIGTPRVVEKGTAKVVHVWIILNVISTSWQLPAIVLLMGVKYNCSN